MSTSPPTIFEKLFQFLSFKWPWVFSCLKLSRFDPPAVCAGHDFAPSSKNSPDLQGLERFPQEWMDVTLVR